MRGFELLTLLLLPGEHVHMFPHWDVLEELLLRIKDAKFDATGLKKRRRDGGDMCLEEDDSFLPIVRSPQRIRVCKTYSFLSGEYRRRIKDSRIICPDCDPGSSSAPSLRWPRRMV